MSARRILSAPEMEAVRLMARWGFRTWEITAALKVRSGVIFKLLPPKQNGRRTEEQWDAIYAERKKIRLEKPGNRLFLRALRGANGGPYRPDPRSAVLEERLKRALLALQNVVDDHHHELARRQDWHFVYGAARREWRQITLYLERDWTAGGHHRYWVDSSRVLSGAREYALRYGKRKGRPGKEFLENPATGHL